MPRRLSTDAAFGSYSLRLGEKEVGDSVCEIDVGVRIAGRVTIFRTRTIHT